MIRINTAADLEDIWGGQTEFEVSVTIDGPDGGFDILAAGHTVAEAVAEARRMLRQWREEDAEVRS